MSTYVLMRILESSPRRYDLGIGILTLGKLGRIYDRLTDNIDEGHRVLDIGCGTGALTIRAAERGAEVRGIDINPGMLEMARHRAERRQVSHGMRFEEMGIAELGNEESESYDAVMSGLCLSELSGDEVAFTLREIHRLLKPGGLLLIADEVVPGGTVKRVLNGAVRVVLVAITYLLTQTTTRAVKDLPGKVESAGFQVTSVRMNGLENLIEMIARKSGLP